jgi:hypothetical protein
METRDDTSQPQANDTTTYQPHDDVQQYDNAQEYDNTMYDDVQAPTRDIPAAQPRDYSTYVCHNCKRVGHIKRDCKQKRARNSKLMFFFTNTFLARFSLTHFCRELPLQSCCQARHQYQVGE